MHTKLLLKDLQPAAQRDPSLDWIVTALECVRQVEPNMQAGALKLIEETLAADRAEALARQNASGAPAPVFWLPAHQPPVELGAEPTAAECADVYAYDAPDNGPLRVIGYAPVMVKYAVRVPVDDGGYEVELFDQREAAQKLLDAMYAEPAPSVRQIKIVPGCPGGNDAA